MFWVLKRTVSLRRFFWVPTTCFGWEIKKNSVTHTYLKAWHWRWVYMPLEELFLVMLSIENQLSYDSYGILYVDVSLYCLDIYSLNPLLTGTLKSRVDPEILSLGLLCFSMCQSRVIIMHNVVSYLIGISTVYEHKTSVLCTSHLYPHPPTYGDSGGIAGLWCIACTFWLSRSVGEVQGL